MCITYPILSSNKTIILFWQFVYKFVLILIIYVLTVDLQIYIFITVSHQDLSYGKMGG